MCSNAGDSAPSKKFEERFLRLSDNGIGFDCEFVIGPEKLVVKGHKLVFAAASEVFLAMFFGDLKEEKVVTIKDLDHDGFEGMKHFIYTGEVNFTSALHALSTYIAARKYLISELINRSTRFIEVNILPSEVLQFFSCCKIHNISEFEELCSKIIENRTNEVVASEYFEEAEIDAIELILKSSSLKLNSELELFVHFERWALAEAVRNNIGVEGIASRFKNLKKHIRFLTISTEEFTTIVARSLLLSAEEKLAIALNKLNFGSQSMPEDLSLLKNRNFICSENYKHNLICTFSILDVNINGHIYDINNIFQVKLKIICIKSRGDSNFYFKLKHIYQGSNAITCLMMTGKLTVKAKERCDDLIVDYQVVTGIAHNEEVIATIPATQLRKECFMRGLRKEVSIEFLFNIERINI